MHYEDESKAKWLILIENKIDAAFTDRRSERYCERGEVYKLEKACHDFATVLIAPESYLQNSHGFDLTISYEKLKNWFVRQKSDRANYKAEVLNSAIERKRRGYQRIKNDEVASFQHQFYLLSEALHTRNYVFENR